MRRSSSEWKETTASRPPGSSSASAAGEAAVELAELVIHRDAQRLEGAGRRIDGVAAACGPTTPRTSSASSPVRVIGAFRARRDDRAGDRAGAPLLAVAEDDVGELAFAQRR